MSNRKKVVVIPVDDAAPEAVYPTVELLRRLRLDVVEALGLDIAAKRGASRL